MCKDKLKKALRPLLTLALAGSLAACGSSSDSVGSSASTITAYVAKGPVNNAVCTLYRATDDAVVAGPATSTGGDVDFGDTTESGLMYVSCSGGTYTDEATGKFATAGALRAVKNVQGSTEFVVTPATEAAVRIAEAGAGIAVGGEAANGRVADYLGLDGIDIVSVRPTNLNTTKAIDDDPGRYGTLLSAISLAAADDDGDGVINHETPSASAMDILIGSIANAVNDTDADTVRIDTVLDEALKNLSTTVKDESDAKGNVDQDVADDVEDKMGPLLPPDLADQTAQSYVKDTAISTLVFVNNGGGSLTACTGSLPVGLSVARSSNNSTCEITGMPTAVQGAADYTITATNTAGSDSDAATVNITVTESLRPPDLENPAPQTYVKDVPISPLTLVNNGGAVTACTGSLPAGLSVAISGNTCEITGTPTAAQPATDHTITATNTAGSGAATVNITVTESLEPPDLEDPAPQTYVKDVPISPLTLVNNGGAVTACTGSLPAGLSVAISGNTCEITGTPTAAQPATDHTITATNTAGSGAATVNITVTDSSLPAPSISGVSPSTGSEVGGTLITISGSNFNGVTSVKVGGNEATSVSTASATLVTAVTPPGTVTGSKVDVEVTNSDKQEATASEAFTYLNACEECELDADGCPF